MEYEGLGFDYRDILKRKYILFFCLGIFILTSSYFYVSQRYQTMKNIEKNMMDGRTELKKIQRYKVQHQDINVYKTYLRIENKIASALLPEKYEEQEFLKILNQCSKSVKIVNVVLPTKQDITKVKQEEVNIYPAKVQLQGDYFDILQFLKDLEVQHFVLQNLKIRADKNGYLDVSLIVGKFIVNR